jgi:hypothetical protein
LHPITKFTPAIFAPISLYCTTIDLIERVARKTHQKYQMSWMLSTRLNKRNLRLSSGEVGPEDDLGVSDSITITS